MSWFTLFIARFRMGDRLRKGIPSDRRSGAAMLLFLPIFFLVFGRLGGPTLYDSTATVRLWLCGMVAATVGMFFLVMFWAKRVSTISTVMAAVVVWAIALWLALTNKFVGP